MCVQKTRGDVGCWEKRCENVGNASPGKLNHATQDSGRYLNLSTNVIHCVQYVTFGFV